MTLKIIGIKYKMLQLRDVKIIKTIFKFFSFIIFFCHIKLKNYMKNPIRKADIRKFLKTHQ